VTEVLSALQTYLPQMPHSVFGDAASTPQPPQAFVPGSEQDTDDLSALQT